jgi:hypothetical protein
MRKLRSLLVLLATLVVPLSGCGGESRRAGAAPGAVPEQATDAGDACSDCDGGVCVDGLCCNSEFASLSALYGLPCNVAGQFCGPGDCSESDGGVITCNNDICTQNYICRADETGSLHWAYQSPPICL